MLKRVSKHLQAFFSLNNLPDKLAQLRVKYGEGHKLFDYEYSSLIEDMLKRKQSLSAYNLLIESYLDNVLIDKQIFTKVERSLGELEDSYKDVLNKMHEKHFVINNVVKKEQVKQQPTSKINKQSLEQNISQTTKRLFKQGEILMGQIFTKTDLQKVVLKNVKINFDYEWINNLQNLPSEGQNQQRKDDLLGDDLETSQQEDSNEEEDEEMTIEDILRSIKSIEIGEVEISTKKNE